MSIASYKKLILKPLLGERSARRSLCWVRGQQNLPETDKVSGFYAPHSAIPHFVRADLSPRRGGDGVKGAPKVAVDAVFDSVSVVTTFKEELAKVGVIFCSFSEAVKEHPELVKKYMGSVVPVTDNYYATLNNAVFSDGSFVYIPPGVRCPMELSTYFRMNAQGTGQFERTLIIADKGSYVSYLEGCTAPMRDENQLHAAMHGISRNVTRS